MATFTGNTTIKLVKDVLYVNAGNDIDGQDIERLCRNLMANATGKVKIACHTKPAGSDLGNRFTAKEFAALIETNRPCLRTSFKSLASGGSFPTPYLSLTAKDAPKAKAKASGKQSNGMKFID
tara:strand:- start:503 stop:871 length:369 start_codon:yes stop_codon:yes gene_type:complete